MWSRWIIFVLSVASRSMFEIHVCVDTIHGYKYCSQVIWYAWFCCLVFLSKWPVCPRADIFVNALIRWYWPLWWNLSLTTEIVIRINCKLTRLPFVYASIMEPPTTLLVPICRDMQLWWDKPPIPSLRNCMPGETCFDDVGRNCACVTYTNVCDSPNKKCFPFKSSHYSFFFNQPLC